MDDDNTMPVDGLEPETKKAQTGEEAISPEGELETSEEGVEESEETPAE